ncbi:MAG: YraN family protein [Armatimonadetes bacterium]|nr:YraN family protein [Armatimonadota bacterium]
MPRSRSASQLPTPSRCHNPGVENRRAVGAEHEDRAADYLLSLGYTLVTRRFKGSGGEIDIVALDGETLVFVEVKYRERGAPEEALGHTKVARFNDAVDAYLAKTGAQSAMIRFDLVAVTPTDIRHHIGAFRAH